MAGTRTIRRELADRALGTLERCPACQSAPAGKSGVCEPCAAWLEAAVAALPPPAGEWCWVGPYAGPLERTIRAFKHGGARRLGGLLARLLESRVRRWDYHPTVVAHVPASGPRLTERGYDQAAVLAFALAVLLSVPHVVALARSPVAASQKHLSRAGRAVNAGGAFGATRSVTGRVLLVDDVLTTGATYRACAAALRSAGAADVRGAFVARTVRSGSRSGSAW